MEKQYIYETLDNLVECNFILKQSHYVRCPALELLYSSLCGPLAKTFGDPCSRQSVAHASLREEPITRRGVLSQASQLFDPFGIIQPIILPIKRLLQRLCQLNKGWNEAIPSHLQDIRMRWVQALSKLQSISIPWWFRFRRDDSKLELHCFSNFSDVGYGAVCYIRVVRGSAIHCAFVLGKSHVGPIKMVIIPEPELSAATLAVKLARMITKELEDDLGQTVFWNDLTTVLRYIENRPRRFSMSIANHVFISRASSQISQWRYVESGKTLLTSLQGEQCQKYQMTATFGSWEQTSCGNLKIAGLHNLSFCHQF